LMAGCGRCAARYGGRCRRRFRAGRR
jgi:hypothetical protein